jgi:prevent-host-death family protein
MSTNRPPGFEETTPQAMLEPEAAASSVKDPTKEPWPKPRRRVTSAELVRNFGELSDVALKEAVHITKNGRERLVLISEEEFQRLTHGERVVRRTEEMPDELVALIEKTEMDPRHDHLNDLLPKDWKP